MSVGFWWDVQHLHIFSYGTHNPAFEMTGNINPDINAPGGFVTAPQTPKKHEGSHQQSNSQSEAETELATPRQNGGK